MEALKSRMDIQRMLDNPENTMSTEDKGMIRGMADDLLPKKKDEGILNWTNAGKALSMGLKGVGFAAENFWPLHDAYYRYKTMGKVGRAVSGVADTVLGLFPAGHGYKKRSKQSRKARNRRKGSKVMHGGMIIPPKDLKKMFCGRKCKCSN